MPYLLDTWYMAAWDSELAPGKGLARRIADQPLFLFRERQGAVRALVDLCPHRLVPLSRGTLRDDAIHCGYHGMAFDGTGRCVHNPHGAIPAAARVRSYPVVERHRMLWVWMGDAGRADPARIPDFGFQDPAIAFTGQRYLSVEADYELEIENIMDLSHIQFLHPETLGGSSVATGDYTATQEGNTVWSRRLSPDAPCPDGLADAMGFPRGMHLDRWMEVQWHAPAHMILHSGGTPAGRPRSEGRGVVQAHCFTPESPGRSHYWFSITFPRAMGPVGERMAEDQADWLKIPFETEDLPMLRAQQARMAEFPGVKPVLLAGDAGGVLARRLLERMIQAEQQQPKA